MLLVSCGANNDAKPESKSEDSEKQPTKILAPHLKTLNEAKTMEKKLQDAEAARIKKMDEQEETSASGNDHSES